MAEAYVTPADDPYRWIFSSDVASYRGSGRFGLGLYHDIEVLANPDFVAYIYNKVKGMVEKIDK